MYKWPEEIKTFIIENVEGKTAQELADMVNARFHFGATVSQIRSAKKNWHIQSGSIHGIRAGLPTELYPADVMQYIRENCAGTSPADMAERLNERFGTAYTQNQIRAYYKNHHLRSGLDGRFQKGRTSHNKGKTWDEFMSRDAQERSRRTTFKKGNLPHNTRPIGHERVSEEGYTYVKVRQRPSRKDCNDNFVAKQRLIWEEHFGPVPDGCLVAFANGDPSDLRIENLVLETKQQHAVKNRCGIHGYDRESARAANMIADIKMQIRRKETATHEQDKH
jgi:hypothetical protein